MMYQFLLLLLTIVAEGPLVGLSMHNLLQVTDLEYDIVNPHDASKNINRTLRYILGLQTALTALLVLGWRWYLFPFHAAYLVHLYLQHSRGRLVTSPTDIYREIKELKLRMFRAVAIHIVSFCIIMFLFIFHLVITMDDSSSGKVAELVKQATATLD